jgi:membrane peptidoglycan carboxypeptidase
VEKAVSPTGELVYIHRQKEPERLLSRLTSEEMKEMCHLVVVAPDGTGRRANIAEYRVGGKTGTAQIALPNGGGYGNKYMAVFAGFAPVVDPEVCGVIVMAEPVRPKHYGGYASAPVFREVVREALIRAHVPEDPVQTDVTFKMEPIEDADTIVARTTLDFMEPMSILEAEIFGVQLVNHDGGLTENERPLPDFTRMTKHQAWKKLRELGISWDFTGAGRVVSQSPMPGTPLSQVPLCQLVFASEADMHRQVDDDASGT